MAAADKSKLDGIEAAATVAGETGDAHAGISSGNPHGLDAADTGAAPASHVGTGGAAHAEVTASEAGFMSAADKAKLDLVAPGQAGWKILDPAGGGLASQMTGMAPGDKFWMLPGTYVLDSDVLFDVANVLLAGSREAVVDPGAAHKLIVMAEGVRLKGFRMQGSVSSDTGEFILVDADRATVRDVLIAGEHRQHGILVGLGRHFSLIENCRIDEAFFSGTESRSAGIAFAGGEAHATVRQCEIVMRDAVGPQVMSCIGPAEIHVVTGVSIEGCRLVVTAGSPGMTHYGIRGGSLTRIRGNRVDGPGAGGLYTIGIQVGSQGSAVGNQVHDCGIGIDSGLSEGECAVVGNYIGFGASCTSTVYGVRLDAFDRATVSGNVIVLDGSGNCTKVGLYTSQAAGFESLTIAGNSVYLKGLPSGSQVQHHYGINIRWDLDGVAITGNAICSEYSHGTFVGIRLSRYADSGAVAHAVVSGNVIVGDDTALIQNDGILVDVSYATVTGNNARNGLTIPIHVTSSATHNVVVGNTGAVTDDTGGTGSNEIAHNMAT
jgi:hypothetical protein